MEENNIKRFIEALEEEKQYYERCRDSAFQQVINGGDNQDLIFYDAKFTMVCHILALAGLYVIFDSEVKDEKPKRLFI